MIELLDVLRLIGGMIYLVLGGDLLVRGALALAQRTSIPPFVIGLTVVAFGTSAPELVISVFAAITGYTDVALGNVVGSNIANIFLVLGAPALISPILSQTSGLKSQTAFMLGVSILFVVMCLDGSLSHIDGVVLISILVGAMVLAWHFKLAMPGVDEPDESDQLKRVLGMPYKLSGAIAFVVIGIVMLPVGADLTVEGAVAIAAALNIPEIVIASTIIALGTSLPELSTTLIAAFHKSSDIALGNVIGSNVFNILLVGGAASAIAALPVPLTMQRFDLWVLLAAAAVLMLFALFRWTVGRAAGIVFLTAYLSYVFILMRP